jgi:DNA-binding NarL/FixJ family response regulator
LVVDADAEFADMVSQAIRDADGKYSVTVETDVQGAIARVQEARLAQIPYDLLIADIRTPGADSMRMIEALAKVHTDLKIVTMTAYHSPELAARVQQLNVHTHLVKPVAPSRFRQLVEDLLSGKASDHVPLPPPLSNAQQAAVERQLANLRRTTGSAAALLIHTGGTVRAIDCMDPSLNAGALAVALTESQRAIAQVLAQTMEASNPIQQSYFGTARFSVCVHRLDDQHAIATIFGPEVREGQMWYAMRESIKALQVALDTENQEPEPVRRSGSSDGFAMVERYFAQQAHPQARTGRVARENPSSATPPRAPARNRAGVVSPPDLSSPPLEGTDAQDQLHDTPPDRRSAPLKMARLNLDEINWELEGAQDWDTLAADTDPSFRGMSFEEAKKRGLLGDLDSDR